MNLKTINKYKYDVLPKIRQKLKKGIDLVDTYKAYTEVLRLLGRYDFDCFNEYLELDEDKTQPNRGFHFHRKNHLKELVKALNEMEIEDKYDILEISMPPRVGKSTYNIRFISWIIGRHPQNTQLATSYSDSIVDSFYIGVLEIIASDRYKEIFPDAPLVNQNAKKKDIWLGEMKRYPSISFIPIGGSMTGRGEACNYLFCDDLVSGIEEALSLTRMEKLWTLYNTNVIQRKKTGCKEIHIATRWSVHDPMSKLEILNENNPRFRSIKIPCFNDEGESNFNFFGGFDKEFYENIRNTMDELNFNALYMQEPIEREGIVYHKEDLQYYFELPSERPDSIIAVCDSKNLGSDYVSSPIGYVYGDYVYIEDVVFNNGLPEITRPLVAQKWVEHNVIRGDVEMNNGGNYYAEDLNELIKQQGGKTSIRTFFSSNNKLVKIITYSDFVKKQFVFKHPSTYKPNSDYGKFMKQVFALTQTGKTPHDDAPDSLAMLAQLFQDLSAMSVKILNRRELNI